MKQPTPSKQKVKDNVNQRKTERREEVRKPGNDLEQIRRELGWGLVEHHRERKKRGK